MNKVKAYAKEWSKISGEQITTEEIDGLIYGFGSEVACLRIFYAYKTGRTEFSKNLKTWFYTND